MTEQHVDDFIAAARAYQGGDPGDRLRTSTGTFLSHAAREPALLGQAADRMAALPRFCAAWVALTLGTAVEGGADVSLSASQMLATFEAWLRALPGSDEDDEDDEDDDGDATALTDAQKEIIAALPLFCQALVAHLARMPEQRAALARKAGFVPRLESVAQYSHGATWVREAILRVSDTLVVLHPDSKQGVRVRYANVSNCFHLFSLLQATIGERLPGGRAPDPAVAARARGDSHGQVHDQAWWHFGDPRCNTAALGASIWGEAHVSTIPRYDDVQVLLLWKPLLGGRSWDSGFFGPHLAALPSGMVLEAELSAKDVADWMQRLGIDQEDHP